MQNRPQYVKVKRLETTYFILCDEYDNVSQLKAKIAALTDRPVETIRLYMDKKVSKKLPQQLDDDYSCHDQKVVNSVSIETRFKIMNEGKEEWEPVEFPEVKPENENPDAGQNPEQKN